MAKTISDEVMKLSIVINGNEGQKTLFDLEKATRKLNEENKALGLQKKLLEKQGKQETEQYKLLTATMKANSAEIVSNKAKMKILQDQIGLTGLTISQLQSKATMLRNTLRNMVPGSADYIKFNNELKQVNARLAEVSGKAKQTKLSLGSMADGFNRYQGMALSFIAVLTGVVLSIQKIIDINGKLAGAQSNVMKTTGKTRQEVDELTKSFGLLHTRTSRINLLGIAEQGGRIGIPKEEILDFVNVMNKASVALGDSFTGGAEEVANKLGKIKFLFEETKDLGIEQTYNSIGSAINELGANGVASEQNIADFTTRIGSLTDALKPTIQETLALGAAFEESGIESEVSARAYGIFMNRASTGAAAFAQVMGLSKKAVEDMINTNPLEFMLQFAEGMKGMNATDVAKTLDHLKINADGANKVIGAMGNNTARFRELIDLSNQSFADGTSLINEYNIKNNDLEAILERISKTVSGWFSSETFVKWLTAGVSWLAEFIGAIEDTDGKTTAWKNTLVFTAKIIAIVTAAMVTNVGWQKLVALWTTRNTEATLLYTIAAKARAFADGVAMVASQAYAATTMLLTGNLKGAQQAFRVLTATMMTTPWGFILGAIAAIGTAYLVFKENVDEAAAVQKMMSDIHAEATKNITKQKSEVDLLSKLIQDGNLPREKQIKIIERLNELIPDHIGHLTLENIKTAEGIGILKKYTDELYKNARAKAVQSKYDKLADERIDIENKSGKEYKSGFGQFMSKITGQGDVPEFTDRKEIEKYVLRNFSASINSRQDKTTGTTIVDKESFDALVNKFANASGLSAKEKELAQNEAKMKALEPELASNIVKDLGKPNSIPTGGSSYKVPGDSEGKTKRDPNSTQEEINRLKLENESKYNAESLKLIRQLEDDKISAMKDGYEKELLIENQRYQREIQDLDRQKIHVDELAKLDEAIAKAKKSKDNTKYNDLLIIRKEWDKKNADLDTQIDAIKEGKMAIHNLKLATIQEKGAKERIEKESEQYEREKLIRDTKLNSDLLALGKNEFEKGKIRKKHEEEELKAQEIFLTKLVQEQQDILAGLNKNVDVNLLSAEQKQKIEDYISDIKNKISSLLIEIAKLKGEKTASSDFSILQGTGTDILGFSPEQWEQVFSNLDTAQEKIAATQTVLGGLQNVWSMYSGFVEANQQKELQALDKRQTLERNKLKRQLDSKLISQTSYDKKIEKLDDEKNKLQAETDYKKAKNERIGALLSIGTNTSIGIMKAVAASPLTGGMPWSAIIGGMGLLQAALVLKNPLPAKGYEEGLYPEYVKREQDGKLFKSKPAGKTRSGLVSNTSHFLVAENGPEMVIDNKAWTKMNPAVKDALIRDLQGIKGWEKGYYNEALKRYEVPASSGTTPAPTPSNNYDSGLLEMVLSIVAENTEVMRDLRDKGVSVSNKDLKSMKNLKEGIEDFEKLKNKNKY